MTDPSDAYAPDADVSGGGGDGSGDGDIDGFGDGTTGAGWLAGGQPLRLQGSLMAAVDAWNYFRATQDIDWLADRGYLILKAAADLACGAATCTSSMLSTSTASPTYELSGVAGFDVTVAAGANPAAVVASVVAVLRCATEAAYALGYVPPPLWATVRYGLSLAVLPTSVTAGAPCVYASDSSGGAGASAAAALPEALSILAEPLGSLADSLGVTASALQQNLAFWGAPGKRLSAATPSVDPLEAALGDLVVLQALATLSQSAVATRFAFATALAAALDAHSDWAAGGIGGWGNLRPADGPAAAPNDLGLSAALLTAFLQGLAGAYVQGGYTPTQYVYATLGVNTASSAVLPDGWDRLTVYGLGPALQDVVLLNGSVVAPGGSTAGLVPWTIGALSL